jgi:hypothetical protein
VRTASTSDKPQRQEQLIRKLKADLKKEKEESKKKDVALRIYETFYTADLKKDKEESKKKDAALRVYEKFHREVKARSSQKSAQRQEELNIRNRKVPGR